MSSPEAFVWMALHFYQSLLEPVWPRRSRSACMQTHLRRMDVGHRGQRSTGVLPHSLFIIFTAYFFVFFLYICFSSDSCAHLIFRRPWQYQVAIQILQVVWSSIDYQVIIDFMWRQWWKKVFQSKLQMKHSKQGGNAEMALWETILYAECRDKFLQSKVPGESLRFPLELT